MHIPTVLMESRLRQAIDQEALDLVYQPIISLRDDSVFAVEALLRWHDEDLGNVPPGTFLPVARRMRMMPQITRFVLRRACRQIAEWNARFGTCISAAVNISPDDLENPGLIDEIGDVLVRSGLPPERLIIEITEETIVREIETARNALEELRNLSINIAIDDFGTGYSALTYLNTFPATFLKLDRSFITGRNTTNEVTAVVTGIVRLAKSIGISVVAEGIETAGDEAFVRDMGCQYVQGYYYAVPQEAGAVESILTSHL